MQVSACVGDYAENPYCIPGLEMSVSCMEELCYCLRENAFLLDASFLDEKLADWVETECALPQLAGELRAMCKEQVSLSTIVTFLMEYVRMYDADVIREVSETVKKGTGLTGIEKRKKQIDHLVKKKKYPAAIHRYDELLGKWKEVEGEGADAPAGKLMASILHNKGVALAQMMEYALAADCFLKAYEQEPEKTHYEAYLAARRMELNETDYIAFIADLQGSYEASMKLEKKMERQLADFTKQERYQRLMALREYRQSGDGQMYYEECDSITRTLRAAYRENVSE